MLSGISALFNVLLNILLIPIYSYVGAAIATIITAVFLLISYLYIISKDISMISFQKLVPKPLFSACVMGFFVYMFHAENIWLLILLSALIYFGILYLIKGFTREDIALVKTLIKR